MGYLCDEQTGQDRTGGGGMNDERHASSSMINLKIVQNGSR